MASAITCMKVLHEVTACIYKQGDEKPAMKWSFLTKIEECDLSSFLRYLKSCGFDDREQLKRVTGLRGSHARVLAF